MWKLGIVMIVVLSTIGCVKETPPQHCKWIKCELCGCDYAQGEYEIHLKGSAHEFRTLGK